MTRSNGGGRDDELFDRLYRKHYRRVTLLYRRLHVSEEDVPDLTQEVFLRFYEAMEEYRGEAEAAYLEAIARHVLFNRIRAMKALRRGGTARTLSIDELLPTEEPPAPQDLDFADREELERKRQLLRDAIRRLPAGQQNCLRLRMEGLKHRQIAGLLRITEDAVKTRLREARKTLRALVGEAPGSEDDE